MKVVTVANYDLSDAKYMDMWTVWYKSLRRHNGEMPIDVLVDADRPQLMSVVRDDPRLTVCILPWAPPTPTPTYFWSPAKYQHNVRFKLHSILAVAGPDTIFADIDGIWFCDPARLISLAGGKPFAAGVHAPIDPLGTVKRKDYLNSGLMIFNDPPFTYNELLAQDVPEDLAHGELRGGSDQTMIELWCRRNEYHYDVGLWENGWNVPFNHCLKEERGYTVLLDGATRNARFGHHYQVKPWQLVGQRSLDFRQLVNQYLPRPRWGP